MCRPIRALTQKKGYDTRDHVLACFGGAGAQHACALAKILGIELILIHRYSAVLSAYGLSLADVIHEVQEPSAIILNDSNFPKIKEKIHILTKNCSQKISGTLNLNENITYEIVLNLRYEGTDTSMMIHKPSNSWNFKAIFEGKYLAEFGFTLPDRDVVIDDIIIKGIEKCVHTAKKLEVYQEIETISRREISSSQAARVSSVFWGNLGRVETPVFELKNLEVGDEINGPALIVESKSTIAIEPNCVALLTKEHVVIKVGKSSKKRKYSCELDPIQLSIFGHRFMSIAEQMGFTLQKTSISTNIKERLDFSCAIFGPDSGLVANAPHIPVHLGSMQEAVKWQMSYLKGNIREGDVIVTNHPAAGGSHLPDITVITPVFDNGSIVFFVASRGHHADIGGLAAGSMPPNSTELFQEGAAIKSFKLVQNGVFDEKGIVNILSIEPAKYDGCSGTRSLKDNLSDLKAQVAANHRGIILVKALIKEYGLEVVQAYMQHIRQNAETCVRDLLKTVATKLGTRLIGKDFMDDGTPICLTIDIDKEKGSASFDFTGTGDEVYANWNAPRSVTYSAIIYCLRCLINLEIPLNQGALVPIEIIIPENSILNPSDGAAVVGGNVMTSQRLCDVILKAFEACAASQGCCNNLTFGRERKEDNGEVLPGFGYYETIGGGAGAGPSWNGKSGVHTHMTNTRLTDPEILERRYPVFLREFGLRKGTFFKLMIGSGGDGLYRGGDGIVREIEFLEKLHVSILSERRVFSPYGLNGGSPGKVGVNYLFRKDQQSGIVRKMNFGGIFIF
jgi:5-oxoprolinase (ATP-hydrolysing)